MSDYENDLAFKPVMTWGDFTQYCFHIASKLEKEDRRIDIHPEYIRLCNIVFFKNGLITTEQRAFIAENVSYERMKNIIDNLYGED